MTSGRWRGNIQRRMGVPVVTRSTELRPTNNAKLENSFCSGGVEDSRMPQITWRWFLSLLISLLTAGMCVAEVEGSPELKHRIRAFKTDVAIRLDGDLAKWRGAGTVTSEGKSLAGHPRHATVYALWIFTWPSMCIPRNFRPASVNATVWED